MKLAVVAVEVCDKCKDVTKGVTTYTISVHDTWTKLVLCEEDARPIEDLLLLASEVEEPVKAPAAKPVAKKTAARGRPGSTARRVVTLEEIEEMKRKERG